MTPLLSLFKNLSVRDKVIAILLSLSLVSLLIMGVVAFTTIMAIGNYAKTGSLDLGETAKNGSTVALAGQSLANLDVVAENKALIVNLRFNITDGEMEILAALVVSLQNNTPVNPQVRSFSRNDPPGDILDGTFAFLVPNSTTTENSEEYWKLTGMDDLLKKVFQEDGDMTAIYIATDSGIMRKYPYDNSTHPDYNPRERAWFIDAKKSSNVVWGEPYDDKGGNGRVVTSSRAGRHGRVRSPPDG